MKFMKVLAFLALVAGAEKFLIAEAKAQLLT